MSCTRRMIHHRPAFSVASKGIACVSAAIYERAHTVLFECSVATASPEYAADLFLLQRSPFRLIHGKILLRLQARKWTPRATKKIVGRITHKMGASHGSGDK